MSSPENEISTSTRQVRWPRPNQNVIFKRLGDQIVLFHVGTDRFYELNPTAARFWELLSEGRDCVRVREQMFAEFEITPDELIDEFNRLLTALGQEDLVINHD
jgi:Coenzyme PQQ synthesis protein D (PqqD)